MKVLALDTSTFTASVAIVDVATGATLAMRSMTTAALSEVLLTLVDDCTREAGVAAPQLAAIAVGVGPGSFTGLRIGLATAKGLAFALDRPLWVASSLAAMAWAARTQVGDADVLVPALDARRGEMYAGLYVRDGGGVRALVAERVLAPAALSAWLAEAAAGRRAVVVGDALDAYAAELAAFNHLDGDRTASAVAIAHVAAAADRVDHLDGGAPAYVRRPEVELQYPDGVPGAARRVLT